jgi:molecular chaperone HtpG
MARVYRLLDREFEIPKRILELNPRHPLIQNLASLITDAPQDPVIDAVVLQLFENQLLVEGLHPNPVEMVPRLHQVLEAATARRASKAN